MTEPMSGPLCVAIGIALTMLAFIVLHIALAYQDDKECKKIREEAKRIEKELLDSIRESTAFIAECDKTIAENEAEIACIKADMVQLEDKKKKLREELDAIEESYRVKMAIIESIRETKTTGDADETAH